MPRDNDDAPSSASSLGERSRLIWAALLLWVVCTGAVLLTLHADAQPLTPGGAQRAGPVAPPPSSPAVAPSAIRDDPTIAPDSRESADNDETFPADI
jgi:hypothetical protein